MMPDPVFLNIHMYGIMIAIGVLCAFATLFLGTVLGITTVSSSMAVDFRGIIILGILIMVGIFFKKKPSPIIMILLSAGLGMTLYSF